ncbi:excisionase [Alsobacter soli]|uniref:Excisionase n=1 Tax=Alsobacter soli TaxID=2109933 RepID=A0A2T1HYF4_9HYPH|nr:excisionase [Alsobacter soli]PSC06726.1 excisionase [Alsobacter soli]
MKSKSIPDLRILPPDALLTCAQVSAVSGYTERALRNWAAGKEGRGPRVTAVEGRPRYRVEDVRAWIGAAP